MTELTKDQMQEIIAKNIAAMLEPDTYVNLGVGLPTLVAKYIKDEQNITVQSENGLIGSTGDIPLSDPNYDYEVISSSGYSTTYKKGASFFDSSLSFGMIRGGHIDATVLGTMEVDQEGNIANYMIPKKLVTGMGGAMDLCSGAKQVIIATFHTQKGAPKILKKCTLPLTALHAAKKVVTEKAVFEIKGGKVILVAYNPSFTVEEILSEVEADTEVSDDLKEMIGCD